MQQALALYRSLYQPSERHPKPQATICVWALVADTADEAQHHALSRERWRLDRDRGIFGPLPTPDSVLRQGYTDAEQAVVDRMRQRSFVGAAPEVAQRLRALAEELALDELVINTWAADPAVRRRSYALLAHEFGLA